MPTSGSSFVTAVHSLAQRTGEVDQLIIDYITENHLIDGVQFNLSGDVSHFAVCSTAAATAQKEVTLTGFALESGAWIAVKWTNTNTASAPTLKVNTLDAKAIYYKGAAVTAGYLAANTITLLVYNGTQFDCLGNFNDGSATTATSLATPRSLAVDLESSTSVTFDGSADQDAIPVTGTLPVSSGGTGVTSIADIQAGKDGSGNTITSTYAPLASPALTGTPTAPTANAATDTTQIATTAFVQSEIDRKITAAQALLYKGTIGSTGTVTALPDTHTVGWLYVVVTAGTYAGQACEVGDYIICNTTYTTADDSHWDVLQKNIDGAVTGPASSVTNRVATFNGTTGKVIKDSGYTIAKSVPSNAVFTDTHYTATPILGGSTATSNATSATANTATYLNLVENAAKSGGIQITGSGATTVSANNGVLTITSTDTNTKVNVTLGTTTKGYLLATSTAPTSTATGVTAIGDTGVYLGTTAGELVATTFTGALSGNASSATKLNTAKAIDGVSFDGQSAITHYGTCNTVADTVEKVVACTSYTLVTGSRIIVKFTVTNTAASPTLNVNSTGAKAIQYRGSAITAGYLAANRTYEFIYDGTNYQLVGDIDTNTNNATAQNISTANSTYPLLLGNTANATANIGNKAALFGSGMKANPSTSIVYAKGFLGAPICYGSCSTEAATAAKVVTVQDSNMFTLTTGAEVIVKFTVTNTAASPTLNVNSTGAKAIYYRGSAISAGYLAANRTYKFVYNGSQYDLVGDIDTNTDTHWTSHLYVGASGATANAATTNGNTYLSLCDNSTNRNNIKIIGAGATTVTSDANGIITINSTDTNTDTNVTQTVTTTSSYYPVIFKNSTSTTTVTEGVRFGSTITANPSLGVLKCNQMTCTTTALSGTAITVTNGACFTKTISAATTFTFSGATGCMTFSLILTNGGAYTVTWPSTVKWAGGSAPTLTASGIDVLTFLTPNGGTNWYGVASSIGAA